MTTTPNIYQRIAALEAKLAAECTRPIGDYFVKSPEYTKQLNAHFRECKRIAHADDRFVGKSAKK